MKKNYYLGYFAMALIFLFISCNQEAEFDISQSAENQDVQAMDKADALEVDELELDGLIPTEITQKTYSHSPKYGTTLSPEEIAAISCGESKTIPLLAGRWNTNVGSVTVSNDGENLFVTYATTGDWSLKSTHLYVGAKNDMPAYWSGYPRLGSFPYHAFPGYFKSSVKSHSFAIPLSSIDLECSTIVASAIVKNKRSYYCYKSSFAYLNENTSKHSSSQHYSYGSYYCNSKEWNKSFEYCKQDCTDDSCMDAFAKKLDDEVVECVDFRINGQAHNAWSTYSLHNWLLGVTQNNSAFELPIYVKKTDDCNTPQTTHLGHVEFSLADNLQDIKIKYVLRDEFKDVYKIEKVNLYVGSEVSPYNGDGTYKTGVTSANFYSGEFVEDNDIIMPWDSNDPYAQVNIIPHAKICKIQD